MGEVVWIIFDYQCFDLEHVKEAMAKNYVVV